MKTIITIILAAFSTNVLSYNLVSENYYDQLKQLIAVVNFECDSPSEDDPYHYSCKRQYIEYKFYNIKYEPKNIPIEDGIPAYHIEVLGYLANGATQDIYQVVGYGDGGNSADSERFEILEMKNNILSSKYGLMSYKKFISAIKKLNITLQSHYGSPVGFDEAW
jgi:hypothetical protein